MLNLGTGNSRVTPSQPIQDPPYKILDSINFMVREEGLEPSRDLISTDFKSVAFTNLATPAYLSLVASRKVTNLEHVCHFILHDLKAVYRYCSSVLQFLYSIEFLTN